jgi:hypothetical protein
MRGQPHDIFEVVRDENNRDVERAPDSIDFVLKCPSKRTVHSREWLIQEEDARFARQRASDGHPLPFTA